MRQKIPIHFIVALASLLVACSTQTQNPPNVTALVVQVPEDLMGMYKLYTTGKLFRCETVVHYFDLNINDRDSTFLYHAFCHPNNLDPTGVKSNLKPRNIIGEWSYGTDSLIRLNGDNGLVVKLKVLPNREIKTYKDNGQELFTDMFFDSSRIYR